MALNDGKRASKQANEQTLSSHCFSESSMRTRWKSECWMNHCSAVSNSAAALNVKHFWTVRNKRANCEWRRQWRDSLVDSMPIFRVACAAAQPSLQQCLFDSVLHNYINMLGGWLGQPCHTRAHTPMPMPILLQIKRLLLAWNSRKTFYYWMKHLYGNDEP